MRVSTIAALASLATLIAAVPLEKRVLVVETVYETKVMTANVYTTVTVAGEKSAVKTGGHKHHKHPAHEKSSSSTPVIVAPSVSTPSSTPVQSPQPQPTSTVQPSQPPKKIYTPPVVSSSTTPPAPVSTTPAPIVAPPPPVYTPPAPSPTPPAPVAKPPTPVYSPPASDNPQPASGGACGESGGECSGDLTFYDAGLGSCGITNDGSTEKVFALAHGMMEAQHASNPNSNPLCGKEATISLDGKSVVVKLVDTCMGCDGQSVDVSRAAFDVLAPESVGRLSDVKWHFN